MFFVLFQDLFSFAKLFRTLILRDGHFLWCCVCVRRAPRAGSCMKAVRCATGPEVEGEGEPYCPSYVSNNLRTCTYGF